MPYIPIKIPKHLKDLHAGTIFFNTDDNKLYIYTDGNLKALKSGSKITAGTEPHDDPENGDLFINIEGNTIYYYYNGEWILLGYFSGEPIGSFGNTTSVYAENYNTLIKLHEPDGININGISGLVGSYAGTSAMKIGSKIYLPGVTSLQGSYLHVFEIDIDNGTITDYMIDYDSGASHVGFHTMGYYGNELIIVATDRFQMDIFYYNIFNHELTRTQSYYHDQTDDITLSVIAENGQYFLRPIERSNYTTYYTGNAVSGGLHYVVSGITRYDRTLHAGYSSDGFWIPWGSDQLLYWNPNDPDTFTFYTLPSALDGYINVYTIYDAYLDKLWITDDTTTFVYNTTTDTIENTFSTFVGTRRGTSAVDGYLYLMTSYGFVYKVDPEVNSWTLIGQAYEVETSNNLYTIVKSEDGTLFFLGEYVYKYIPDAPKYLSPLNIWEFKYNANV